MADVSQQVAEALADVGRRFDARGWVLGTSGNFSQVISRLPLRLAITRSSAFKGQLTAADILIVDDRGQLDAGEGRPLDFARGRPLDVAHPSTALGVTLSLPKGQGRPSAETPLHVMVVQTTGAGAVLHTHSVWSTILSEEHAGAGGLAIEGYEMLKGLEGVTTHEHREWLPILANDQDVERLASRARTLIETQPAIHGFLLQRHGLYTWGRDLREAARHVEILEFLLEVIGRSHLSRSAGLQPG